MGVLRSLYGKKENRAEMVPADYVINCGLAIAYDVAATKTLNENKEQNGREPHHVKFEDQVPIYNFVSSAESPITWGTTGFFFYFNI